MGLTKQRSRRFVTTVVAVVLAVSACTPTPVPSSSVPAIASPPIVVAPTPAEPPRPGGTIYLLSSAEQLNHIDPQRVYTPEDLAFLGSTIYRSLVSYAASPDMVAGTTLVPDLATDIGRPAEGGRTWSFTLRVGVTFQTGDPITCDDVRYGVSRTFANNVISEGPTYAVQHLDIPPATNADSEAGFLSSYRGPYDSTPEQQALFDRAVECSPDNRTITFHLNKPVADFNYVTSLAFSPVPRAADTGETYGQLPSSPPIASGPYMVQSYTVGEGGRLVLVRNPEWDPASDALRKAYPDRWELEFALEPEDVADRLLASSGSDASAASYPTQSSGMFEAIFDPYDASVPSVSTRALADFDPYVRYDWINVQNVPDAKVRQAMMVALDRASIRDILGGEAFGTFADGVIKPTIGRDYAATGIWDTFFGGLVPTSGDPELARRLLRESGVEVDVLQFTAADTPTNQKVVEVVVESLARAGLTVEYVAPCQGYGCSIVFDPNKAADFGTGGWGHDWPNASTVIPSLFTKQGGWNLSNVDDPEFSAAVEDAYGTLDRAAQARKWQALHRQAIQNAWVIPMFFGHQRRVAGTNVGPIYQWPAYSSWPYGVMHVTP